jgi:hypothetical protein
VAAHVHADVDAAGLGGDGVGVDVDRPLVGGVDLGRLGRPAGATDVGGDLLQAGPGAAGQEHPRPLAGEGPGHRTPDRPAASVDHGVLALEQHDIPPV